MRKLIGGLVLAAFALGIGACGDSTGPKENVTGTYMLQTVGGFALPLTLYQDDTELDELTDGSITLNSDRSWSAVLNGRVTTAQGVQPLEPAQGSGTYTLDGTTLLLTDETAQGQQLHGTVSGGTLTLLENDGLGGTVALVFKR